MKQQEVRSKIGEVNQALRDLEFKLKQLSDELEKKEMHLNAVRRQSVQIEKAMADLVAKDIVEIELYQQGCALRLKAKAALAASAEERNKSQSALEAMKLHRDELENHCGVLTKNLEKASKNVLSF